MRRSRLRWAIDQFQREDVLFREAERFSLASWLRHLFRDREPTPTGGQATLCFALILTSSWFLMQYLAFQEAAGLTLGTWRPGSSFILIPPLLMAVFLTSSAGADAPARLARAALSRCWPSRWSFDAQSAGQRAAADRRAALPDLVDDQGRARPVDGSDRRAWRSRSSSSRWSRRSARNSRSAASSSPGWSASTGPARRSCSRP